MCFLSGIHPFIVLEIEHQIAGIKLIYCQLDAYDIERYDAIVLNKKSKRRKHQHPFKLHPIGFLNSFSYFAYILLIISCSLP